MILDLLTQCQRNTRINIGKNDDKSYNYFITLIFNNEVNFNI